MDRSKKLKKNDDNSDTYQPKAYEHEYFLAFENEFGNKKEIMENELRFIDEDDGYFDRADKIINRVEGNINVDTRIDKMNDEGRQEHGKNRSPFDNTSSTRFMGVDEGNVKYNDGSYRNVGGCASANEEKMQSVNNNYDRNDRRDFDINKQVSLDEIGNLGNSYLYSHEKNSSNIPNGLNNFTYCKQPNYTMHIQPMIPPNLLNEAFNQDFVVKPRRKRRTKREMEEARQREFELKEKYKCLFGQNTREEEILLEDRINAGTPLKRSSMCLERASRKEAIENGTMINRQANECIGIRSEIENNNQAEICERNSTSGLTRQSKPMIFREYSGSPNNPPNFYNTTPCKFDSTAPNMSKRIEAGQESDVFLQQHNQSISHQQTNFMEIQNEKPPGVFAHNALYSSKSMQAKNDLFSQQRHCHFVPDSEKYRLPVFSPAMSTSYNQLHNKHRDRNVDDSYKNQANFAAQNLQHSVMNLQKNGHPPPGYKVFNVQQGMPNGVLQDWPMQYLHHQEEMYRYKENTNLKGESAGFCKRRSGSVHSDIYFGENLKERPGNGSIRRTKTLGNINERRGMTDAFASNNLGVKRGVQNPILCDEDVRHLNSFNDEFVYRAAMRDDVPGKVHSKYLNNYEKMLGNGRPSDLYPGPIGERSQQYANSNGQLKNVHDDNFGKIAREKEFAVRNSLSNARLRENRNFMPNLHARQSKVPYLSTAEQYLHLPQSEEQQFEQHSKQMGCKIPLANSHTFQSSSTVYPEFNHSGLEPNNMQWHMNGQVHVNSRPAFVHSRFGRHPIHETHPPYANAQAMRPVFMHPRLAHSAFMHPQFRPPLSAQPVFMQPVVWFKSHTVLVIKKSQVNVSSIRIVPLRSPVSLEDFVESFYLYLNVFNGSIGLPFIHYKHIDSLSYIFRLVVNAGGYYKVTTSQWKFYERKIVRLWMYKDMYFFVVYPLEQVYLRSINEVIGGGAKPDVHDRLDTYKNNSESRFCSDESRSKFIMKNKDEDYENERIASTEVEQALDENSCLNKEFSSSRDMFDKLRSRKYCPFYHDYLCVPINEKNGLCGLSKQSDHINSLCSGFEVSKNIKFSPINSLTKIEIYYQFRRNKIVDAELFKLTTTDIDMCLIAGSIKDILFLFHSLKPTDLSKSVCKTLVEFITDVCDIIDLKCTRKRKCKFKNVKNKCVGLQGKWKLNETCLDGRIQNDRINNMQTQFMKGNNKEDSACLFDNLSRGTPVAFMQDGKQNSKKEAKDGPTSNAYELVCNTGTNETTCNIDGKIDVGDTLNSYDSGCTDDVTQSSSHAAKASQASVCEARIYSMAEVDSPFAEYSKEHPNALVIEECDKPSHESNKEATRILRTFSDDHETDTSAPKDYGLGKNEEISKLDGALINGIREHSSNEPSIENLYKNGCLNAHNRAKSRIDELSKDDNRRLEADYRSRVDVTEQINSEYAEKGTASGNTCHAKDDSYKELLFQGYDASTMSKSTSEQKCSTGTCVKISGHNMCENSGTGYPLRNDFFPSALDKNSTSFDTDNSRDCTTLVTEQTKCHSDSIACKACSLSDDSYNLSHPSLSSRPPKNVNATTSCFDNSHEHLTILESLKHTKKHLDKLDVLNIQELLHLRDTCLKTLLDYLKTYKLKYNAKHLWDKSSPSTMGKHSQGIDKYCSTGIPKGHTQNCIKREANKLQHIEVNAERCSRASKDSVSTSDSNVDLKTPIHPGETCGNEKTYNAAVTNLSQLKLSYVLDMLITRLYIESQLLNRNVLTKNGAISSDMQILLLIYYSPYKIRPTKYIYNVLRRNTVRAPSVVVQALSNLHMSKKKIKTLFTYLKKFVMFQCEKILDCIKRRELVDDYKFLENCVMCFSTLNGFKPFCSELVPEILICELWFYERGVFYKKKGSSCFSKIVEVCDVEYDKIIRRARQLPAYRDILDKFE